MRIASSWMFALVSLVGCQRVAESEIYQEAAAAAPAPARCRPGTAAEVRGVAWSDVQDALDQAQPYDVVNICPGVWQGNFVLPPHAGPLELRGVTGDPDDVVLDGGGSGILLDDALGGTWRLRALTLQNAETLAELSRSGTVAVEVLDCLFLGPAYDVGLTVGTTKSVTVKRSAFRGLSVQALRAFPLVAGNQILLEDVLFEDNGPDTVAEIGFSSWATPAVPDLVTLRHVSFRNNVTEGGGSLRMEPSWSARVLVEDEDHQFADLKADETVLVSSAAGGTPTLGAVIILVVQHIAAYLITLWAFTRWAPQG